MGDLITIREFGNTEGKENGSPDGGYKFKRDYGEE